MDLQEFKRWHWMVIGLLVGLAWAGLRLFYGFEADASYCEYFEHVLLATPDHPAFVGGDDGKVYLSNLVVHPPIVDEAPEARKSPVQVQWVTAMLHFDSERRDPKNWRKVIARNQGERAVAFKSPIPYVPGKREDDFVQNNMIRRGAGYLLPNTVAGYKPPKAENWPSMRDYLDELRRKYGMGAISYRYHWWESRAAVLAIYPLAGVLGIGGIWPVVLNLMIGAGLGPERKKQQMDLSRYAGRSTSAPVRAKSDLTEADRQRLDQMNATLEQELAANATHSGGSVNAPAESATAPIRELHGAKAELPQPAEQAKAAKTFGAGGADFYPTEIHKNSPPPPQEKAT